ncbi:hypothetical protein CEE45_02195 [Candidatus Heimdallarchaeota archaeon B3_Heim]|nr:MAG: hypothetical protein CEE45_02195 [Candidatus Heimdallarchaeota archaeon B3_Heim]
MNIVELIRQWASNSEDLNLNKISTKHSLAYHHYLTEIIRYWNHLNFIAKKTLRSLQKDGMRDILKIEACLYITYRYFWEEAQFSSVIKEISKNEEFSDRNLVHSFYKKLSSFKWDIALQKKATTEKLSIKHAIPTFTINTLLPVMDYKSIKENVTAMDERARKGIFYFRVNNLIKSTVPFSELTAKINADFSKIGVKVRSDENFPLVLQASVRDKSKILKSKYYRKKMIIIQDKASFSSVLLLDPQPNEIVCDLCAAPGIKTSLISQQTSDKAFVVAGDFHHNRTNEMVSLLKSVGVTNVGFVQWDGIQPPLRNKLFDKILLDAPCTGSGTFTANPVLKWKQSGQFLNRHIVLQEKLLKSALSLLKEGGTLVYSTCSLYPEEGEYQIKKILDDQVKFADTPSWLPPSYTIDGSTMKGSGRFLPADHHTIGFFVSKMIKKVRN